MTVALVDQFAQVAVDFGVAPRRVSRANSRRYLTECRPGSPTGSWWRATRGSIPTRSWPTCSEANEQLGVTTLATRGQCVRRRTPRRRRPPRAIRSKVTSASSRPARAPCPRARRLGRARRSSGARHHRARAGLDRSALPMIRSFVRGNTFYMVSRPGGYNVLGASSEERLEAGAQVGEVQRLLRDALDVVPALETATVVENRGGKRPASDDLRPFFEVLAKALGVVVRSLPSRRDPGPARGPGALRFAERARDPGERRARKRWMPNRSISVARLTIEPAASRWRSTARLCDGPSGAPPSRRRAV